MTTHPLRRLVAAATLALAATSLVACSTDGEAGSASGSGMFAESGGADAGGAEDEAAAAGDATGEQPEVQVESTSGENDEWCSWWVSAEDAADYEKIAAGDPPAGLPAELQRGWELFVADPASQTWESQEDDLEDLGKDLQKGTTEGLTDDERALHAFVMWVAGECLSFG